MGSATREMCYAEKVLSYPRHGSRSRARLGYDACRALGDSVLQVGEPGALTARSVAYPSRSRGFCTKFLWDRRTQVFFCPIPFVLYRCVFCRWSFPAYAMLSFLFVFRLVSVFPLRCRLSSLSTHLFWRVHTSAPSLPCLPLVSSLS